MNSMKHVVFLLTNIIVTVFKFDPIESIGKSNGCSDQEHSPLCFCRSLYRSSILTDLFLARVSLFQCDDSFPIRYCRQSRFHPPSFHLTQLIPQLINFPYCLEDIHCLHTLHSIQNCQRCQLTYNNSYRTDRCLNFCEHNTSCGFICLNQPVIVSINCNICREQKQNINCRCIKSSSCLQSSYKTTATPRWMQKRGFPAAGILALLILAGALLAIVIKLID